MGSVGGRWTETRDALVGIIGHAIKVEGAEIHLRFLNSPVKKDEVKVS